MFHLVMPCTYYPGLALLPFPRLVLSLSCKYLVSATHVLVHFQPRSIICLSCLESALKSVRGSTYTDLDPVLPALPYSLTIPVEQMHSWASKQRPTDESYCGNTTAERWRFPYIRVVTEDLGFSARSRSVPIWMNSSWWPLQWWWFLFRGAHNYLSIWCP